MKLLSRYLLNSEFGCWNFWFSFAVISSDFFVVPQFLSGSSAKNNYAFCGNYRPRIHVILI